MLFVLKSNDSKAEGGKLWSWFPMISSFSNNFSVATYSKISENYRTTEREKHWIYWKPRSIYFYILNKLRIEIDFICIMAALIVMFCMHDKFAFSWLTKFCVHCVLFLWIEWLIDKAEKFERDQKILKINQELPLCNDSMLKVINNVIFVKY